MIGHRTSSFRELLAGYKLHRPNKHKLAHVSSKKYFRLPSAYPVITILILKRVR
jgi:hypothetical protein